MNFLKNHFKPQPNTTAVRAAELKTGDVIVTEGGNLKVSNAYFGDPHKLGFVSNGKRTAAPFVIEADDGRSIVLHPRHDVRILS